MLANCVNFTADTRLDGAERLLLIKLVVLEEIN